MELHQIWNRETLLKGMATHIWKCQSQNRDLWAKVKEAWP
jgi:hypothetical protein